MTCRSSTELALTDGRQAQALHQTQALRQAQA